MNMTDHQVDALKELINIGVGRAAGMLNTMLRSHVRLRVPLVEILSPSDLEKKLQELGKETLSTVQLGFKGLFSGVASLVFPTESAAKLVAILTDDDIEPLDLDSIRIGTLTEVGNIVLNGVMGVIGNELRQHIRYSVPTYVENPINVLLTSDNSDLSATVVWAQAQFSIEQYRIDGDIILLFEVGSFDMLLTSISQALEIQL